MNAICFKHVLGQLSQGVLTLNQRDKEARDFDLTVFHWFPNAHFSTF